MPAKKIISFVVPVFNEEENVLPLYNAVVGQMKTLPEYDYEIIFTDNHSTDKTFNIIEKLAMENNKIKAIRFSKNFGYQKSIYTGYYHASGDCAIQLDCDLQDPIFMINTFVEYWENGYEVVYGVRRSRKEAWWINSLRKIFYWLINKLSEEYLPRDAGDFRLVDRKILIALKEMNDEQPYLRGSISALGFKQVGVPYDRNERLRGESKFSFKQLLQLSIDGILNHSVVPLRLASYTGIIISAFTFLGFFVYLVGKLLGAQWPAGFATTTILILLSLSLNGLFLGIIGEYLGRIYRQVKRGPFTIIEKQVNYDAKIMGVENRKII
ncbi:glycosyltransferase family 2 protein [Paenibacillus sp. GYB004]|uniref:glycosyltransferase family 2 protein n=1 Tax=Paenibacillus sp. GYB004 TaxID=2994393 RepID=UPI002F966889